MLSNTCSLADCSHVPIHAPTQPLRHIPVQVLTHWLLHDKGTAMVPNDGIVAIEMMPITGSTFFAVTLKNSRLLCNSLFAIILIGIKIVIASHWAGTHASSQTSSATSCIARTLTCIITTATHITTIMPTST